MTEQEQEKLRASGMCQHGNEPGGCAECRKREIVDPKRLSRNITGILETAPEGECLGKYLHTELVSKCQNIYPDHVDDLNTRLSNLDNIDDVDVLVPVAVEEVNNFLADHFTKEEHEKIHRQAFIESGGFTPLNEILSFNTHEDTAYIHLAPAETLGPKALIKNVKDGFVELARLLETEEGLKEIKSVVASSWIVAKHPKLIESAGFTIDGPIDEKNRRGMFPGDTREIWTSHMDRKEFLEKYLKNLLKSYEWISCRTRASNAR